MAQVQLWKVQTFVLSKRKFVRSKIDNLCVHVQTIVRSKGLMSRLSCVQKCLYPDLSCLPKENSCAPKLINRAFMSRLSCVQRALCPDFRAFKKSLCPDFLCVQKLTMCTKIDDLICPKKKTSPKWFAQSNFLNSSPITAKVEHTHQQWAQLD